MLWGVKMKFYVLWLVYLPAPNNICCFFFGLSWWIVWDMLRNQVGISNDLAGLLYCRSSAEMVTSRTPSAEIITLSAALSGDKNFISARRLVGCRDNGVTLWHCRCSGAVSCFTDVWRKTVFIDLIIYSKSASLWVWLHNKQVLDKRIKIST
jgi:hypothetical protein